MSNAIPKQMFFNGSELVIEEAPDETKKRDEIQNYLLEVLGSSFQIIKERDGQRVVTGKYSAKNGKNYYLIVANITFMGGQEGQHPKDLKRIQYNVAWRDFYKKYSTLGEVLWLGLYSYKNTKVWGIFKPETYLKKHEGTEMLSKSGFKAQYSCHIFLNDLFQGIENKNYSKIDKKGNCIETVRYDYLKNRFEGVVNSTNPIIDIIKEINNTQISWNNWLVADEAIPFMKSLKQKNGFNQWKQNLWNGWIIEAKYSDYLYKKPSAFIDYVATSKNIEVINEYKAKGFDLAFPHPEYHFIGDLKAVCEGSGNTLLNDRERVLAALKEYKKIWFIIYIHDKKQGNTNDYEMVRWRNRYILDSGEWDTKKVYDELDAYNTPHSVSYSEMVIIELNEITKNKYFSIGPQFGLNSDGKERNDKFKISKKLLKSIDDDSFVIYRYKPKK